MIIIEKHMYDSYLLAYTNKKNIYKKIEIELKQIHPFYGGNHIDIRKIKLNNKKYFLITVCAHNFKINQSCLYTELTLFFSKVQNCQGWIKFPSGFIYFSYEYSQQMVPLYFETSRVSEKTTKNINTHDLKQLEKNTKPLKRYRPFLKSKKNILLFFALFFILSAVCFFGLQNQLHKKQSMLATNENKYSTEKEINKNKTPENNHSFFSVLSAIASSIYETNGFLQSLEYTDTGSEKIFSFCVQASSAIAFETNIQKKLYDCSISIPKIQYTNTIPNWIGILHIQNNLEFLPNKTKDSLNDIHQILFKISQLPYLEILTEEKKDIFYSSGIIKNNYLGEFLVDINNEIHMTNISIVYFKIDTIQGNELSKKHCSFKIGFSSHTENAYNKTNIDKKIITEILFIPKKTEPKQDEKPLDKMTLFSVGKISLDKKTDIIFTKNEQGKINIQKVEK